jgi:hypothetical protein
MYNSDSVKWAKFNKLGRTQYVLRYGVLGWGIPTGILFALFTGLMDGWDLFLPQLIRALVLFPLIGILCGRIWWRQLARKHDPASTTACKRASNHSRVHRKCAANARHQTTQRF